jgi:hypothetical protein
MVTPRVVSGQSEMRRAIDKCVSTADNILKSITKKTQKMATTHSIRMQNEKHTTMKIRNRKITRDQNNTHYFIVVFMRTNPKKNARKSLIQFSLTTHGLTTKTFQSSRIIDYKNKFTLLRSRSDKLPVSRI